MFKNLFFFLLNKPQKSVLASPMKANNGKN